MISAVAVVVGKRDPDKAADSIDFQRYILCTDAGGYVGGKIKISASIEGRSSDLPRVTTEMVVGCPQLDPSSVWTNCEHQFIVL